MRYEVIFRGKLVSGYDEATVRGNVARLFRIEESRVAALFAGKRVVLKRNLDRETAEKYRLALRKAGAVVAVVGERAASDSPAAPKHAATQPAQPQTGSEARPLPPTQPAEDDGQPSLAPPGEILVPRSPVSAVSIDTSSLSMADVGAIVDDRDRPAPAQIDTSHLAAAEIEQPLDDSPTSPPPEMDLSQLSLAADDGPFDDSPRRPAPVFDLSGLSAEEVDSPLDGARRPAPPEIDTSDLKLD